MFNYHKGFTRYFFLIPQQGAEMKCPQCKIECEQKYANYGFMTTRIVEEIYVCPKCGKEVEESR